MTRHAGVLVFAELSAGELDDAGKGILAEGRRLATTLGTSWAAGCFAAAGGAAQEAFRRAGVPDLVEIDGPPGLADLPEAQAEALVDAARALGAKVILLAHTDQGASLAPVMAARLSAAIFTEAVSYGRDFAGLTLRRQALGAQVVEQRIWTDAARDASCGEGAVTPLVLTMSRRALSAVVPPGTPRGEARRTSRTARVDATGEGARVTERIPPDPQTVDVAEAQVIFTAGKGCDRGTFEAMCELARLVGASVGVTRPVYDLGWTGFERMIGQTGKTVVPRLYFAWGISGSMHHVGGITESRRIVCMNLDPKAAIFPSADEGFVADVREVLPRVLAHVHAAVDSREVKR
ncbi:electron transfer flavoprotein subunit alpha/FixB family protein [Anaeromyxobacter oryzae]|uniref:Electron transfer flavoprotein subunit alpha n=1 Tax=Anaeromyxobacter oryzae TaxID=2918170 RepID=A0ABN6MXC9_9BACT|nr:electron transfer flavoprotein subunit alpha/FixB family protein [Anaeromyxobacter oryzae]BDG05570.1 electron transfer flavoprotein subunit alpha [Anaeromyxobacter oryzae]